MAYRITEECLACGVCADECPSGAISEGDNIFVIDPDVCTNCGTCMEVCPNEAIVEE
ncbi:MAG: 4Fe-4S binding protein [Thermoanaerobacteraceae bacterium]|uniref:4Fe-4S binding protein n=1 Tax=Thermanaeromonas sp. C210 TaxID=2731925 RepID=UPI00155CAB25|nr:4Fe-4S binding protein [Thermanaeromonas sp. C210]MBE3581578.1 4Fe-4S binding protein [Thermoanaerobacteraceae bacterium]GFN23855.1 4Fe-4S ferredoxin [Thermanaeromonas sp. C210]